MTSLSIALWGSGDSRSFPDRCRVERARLPLGEHYELFARVENLFDAKYQTVATYGTYGRSAYAGAKMRW